MTKLKACLLLFVMLMLPLRGAMAGMGLLCEHAPQPMQAAAQHAGHDHARHGVIERTLEPLAGLEQYREVDASVDAHALQHVHEVFGRDVAGRGWRDGRAVVLATVKHSVARPISRGRGMAAV